MNRIHAGRIQIPGKPLKNIETCFQRRFSIVSGLSEGVFCLRGRVGSFSGLCLNRRHQEPTEMNRLHPGPILIGGKTPKRQTCFQRRFNNVSGL